MARGRFTAPRHHPSRLTHGKAQLLVCRFRLRGGAEQAADAGGSRDRNTEHVTEKAAAFPVRETQPLVQRYKGGVCIRPELTGRRSHRVGRLERMTPLQGPAAVPALAEVNRELTVDGTARNFGLILFGRVRFLNMPSAALGALFGHRRLIPLVDLFGRDGRTMRLLAIASSRLAAGRLRLKLGAIFFAKGRRLALAGPLRGFQGRSQPLDRRTQLAYLPAELLVLGFQLPNSCISRVHADAKNAAKRLFVARSVSRGGKQLQRTLHLNRAAVWLNANRRPAL